ncbi:plastocyanin/azurin family copper-binding protein [Paenibacillus sp. RRE4]|uniref:plastocyanin/azurin family copper-binding protein n=1 Tax=Paenibacillus sp. RRE4 TaxID=2962587 RepID=UPI00288182C8|nr:plastocyanin/azurin family copper-binding protein [Paenibacillus sp. RRE4]MDT0125907.1 plastocyanin/azurin family copper-binding protein [Paenibacillus sp. RRE4]
MNKSAKYVSLLLVLGLCLTLPQLAGAEASAHHHMTGSTDKKDSKPSSKQTTGSTANKAAKPTQPTKPKKSASATADKKKSTKKKNDTSKSSKDTKKPAVTQVEKSKTYVIEISDFAFQTADLKIKVGDRVEFVNKDQVEHSVVAEDDSFDTGLLGEGEKSVVTFKKAGEINYHCGPHPSMKGVIKVLSK